MRQRREEGRSPGSGALRRARPIVAAGALLLGACRACDDTSAPVDRGVQPPMPTGMLVPVEAGAAPEADRLRASRGKRAGWFELVGAAEDAGKRSLWISAASLSLLQNAFARAQPGFGPFGERVVRPEAMGKLAVELRALRVEWAAIATVAEAKTRLPGSDALADVKTDDEWRAARGAFASTVDDLVALVEALGAAGLRIRSP